ncbi:MAG: dihydropteroate synthase [Bacteroidales bacterium]|jgi:dihydropteroate synthase|nr:dihydropteroate synthase [Bacteroidales bacterium]
MFINVKGTLLDLSHPRVMGIINVTEDSFYEGSRFLTDDQVIAVASEMLDEGADILDIGGCSTRPGALPVSEEEELKRVCHAVELIKNRYHDAVVSVDTFRASVAGAAVRDAGADIINDISGGQMDAGMFPLVTDLNVPYIMMHMQGTPQTMQLNPHYDDVIADILIWFSERITLLQQAGVKDIIIDPGFGFGKSAGHNFEMLRRLEEFHTAGLPLMVGLSRKSLIWRTLNLTPDKALAGTVALHMTALMKGASLLRVHDVREAKEVITLFEKIYPQGSLFDHYS